MGKKATLRLELDRDSYVAGDTVNGTVYLSVSSDIKTKAAFTLSVNGEEYVKYNEALGEVVIPHSQKTALIDDQLVLASDGGYSTGEYVFPFNYQLQPTLPGNFRINRRHAGHICDIDAGVKYSLKLHLPLKGAFTSDLKLEQSLQVQSSQSIAYPVQSQSESTAQHPKLLGVIRQGNFELSGTLQRDAYVSGDTLQIRCSISNGSSMEARSVSVRLYENLAIHSLDGVKAKTHLAEKEFPGIAAGASLDEVYALDLVGRAPRYAVIPSTASQLVSWTHHVEISCKFRMSPSIKIEIPVKILPAPTRLQAATAVTPELVAESKLKNL